MCYTAHLLKKKSVIKSSFCISTMGAIDYALKTVLVYVSPNYAKRIAEKYWTLHDEEYRRLRVKQFENGVMYDIYKKILEIIKPKKSFSILDAGCGSGELVYYFYRDGYNIRGFDISPKAVEMANKLIGEELCYVDDFLSLKDRTKSYDIIYIQFFVLYSSQTIENCIQKFLQHSK